MKRIALTLLLVATCLLLHPGHSIAAATSQNSQTGSVGLQGTISAPAPTHAATITTPVSGGSFTSLPITVAGLCSQGVMVKIFSNNIFVGSVPCTNGSYSLQVDLFSGENELIARVYDNLDQAGPDSATVTVTFNDDTLGAFESRVSLTSIYGEKGATPGDTLSWPIILTGGAGPYALSTDWGDGKPVTLQSIPFSGTINISHTYDTAGIYRVIIKAVDSQGSTAYLQLIGVGDGSVASTGIKTDDSTGATKTVVQTKYSLIPSLVAIPLILLSFWLGRKYERQVIRRRIEASATEEYTNRTEV
jgi:hypothetical protein